MPQRTLCRLCITTCSIFKCLYDDSGQLNGVYKIAVKYFDPKILTRRNGGGDKTIVICMECWQHIQDFYSFQQTVLQNQTQLKTLKLAVRIEKLPVAMIQTPPLIKDEITVTENTVSVFDIVQIQNTDTPKTILDTDYDMVIKDQSIVLQITSNIEPATSLNKVCEQQLQVSMDINDGTDESLNCAVSGNTRQLLQEHYDNNDNSIEIDEIESNNFVESLIQPTYAIGGGNINPNMDLLQEQYRINNDNNVNSIEIDQIDCNNLVDSFIQLNCDICGNTFPNMHSLQEHHSVNHKNNDNSIEIDQVASNNLVESFLQRNCDICGNTFPNMHSLHEHYRTDHGNNVDSIEIDEIESNNLVEISDEDNSDSNLRNDDMEPNNLVEISDDDIDDNQNDNTIEIADEFTGINDLMSKSFYRPTYTLNENNQLTSKVLKAPPLIHDDFFAKWNPYIECPLCKIKFEKYSQYSRHFRRKHPSEKFFYICCHRKFIRRYQLVEHISLHLNPNMFKCYICGSKLTRKASLKRHFQLQHSNVVTREEIEQLFQDRNVQKTSIERGNEIHDGVLNDIQNQNLSHSLVNDTGLEHLAQNPSTSVASLQNVPQPMTSAVSSVSLIPSEEQKLSQNKQRPEKTKFKCPLCKSRFSYNGNLIKHIKFRHKNPTLAAIEQMNYAVDLSNAICSLDNAVEAESDEDCVISSIVSTNDSEIHEVISDSNDGITNDNGDSECSNEIRLPALEIVDIKDEIPLNSLNESSSNNLITLN